MVKFNQIPEFLTEYNWSLTFDTRDTNKDIYINSLFTKELNTIVQRIKLENNKITVYYCIPTFLLIQDMELSSTTIIKLLMSDCIGKISIHVMNKQNEEQFIINNTLVDKKPTYEMVFGAIENNPLQLIVHYDIFNQEII